MNLRLTFSAIILAVLLTSFASLSGEQHTPKQLLFKTSRSLEIQRGRTGLSAFDSFLDDVQALSVSPLHGMKENRWFSANLVAEPDWDSIITNPPVFEGIDIIQPNYLNTLHVIPNDPWYSLQQMNLVSLPQAWNYTTGSAMVIVGIIDSGVLTQHPDLIDNLYINPLEIPDNNIDDDNNGYIDDWQGWDFADAPELEEIAAGDYTVPDNDVTDENFHGTHVAGIAGAVSNNGIGVSGVCWNIKLLLVRAGFRTTGAAGYLQDDDAAAAIIYATDMGATVMNLSWGDTVYSAIIADACSYANTHGVTVIASAGNAPVPLLNYPARLASTISVGAIDPYKTLAGFSSYGPELDLVAPGQQIYSTYQLDGPDMYKELSGTSMSAPFVTGAVALLKSISPNLTPDEVRARLLSTTDDLGPNGFDIQYGHGLLNVRKLLESLAAPYVRVTFPADHIGISQDFDILGTVSGEDFFRYSVMCSRESDTGSMDWKDVYHNTTSPHFIYQPVEEGVIATFRIPDLMPEGTYILRIQYESRDGSIYNLFRSFMLDMSAPYIDENGLQIYKRYDKQNVKYYASAVFNELVRSELIITDSSANEYTVFPAVLDSVQVWQFPPEIAPGSIDIRIIAYNQSNLAFASTLMTDVADVSYEIIPDYGYRSRDIGAPMIPLNRFYDFDGNTYPEFIAMELPPSGYGTVRAYELADSVLIQKFQYAPRFLPIDLGNTSLTGQELMTSYLQNVIVYETPDGGSHFYPDDNIVEWSSVAGGIFGDYDNDMSKDIILVKDLTQGRVIELYKRTGTETFSPVIATIQNPTPTDARNMFVPTLFCTNLDNDNKPDILTADTDGDVMIFEANLSTGPAMTWSHRLPVNNTYYLATGNFDGYNAKDFIVGGYSSNVQDPNRNYWYFEGFTRAADNQYVSMGVIRFNEVLSQNAIQTLDLDDDGMDEIILALSPNLYVVKYIDGKFQPIFYGSSLRTYQVAAWKQFDQSFFLTNDITPSDSTKAFLWTPDIPFTGPPTPANLIVRPVDGERVWLAWQNSNASLYRVFRKEEGQNPIMLAELTETSFTDTTVTAGTTYYYSVAAVDYAFSPSESHLSLWVSALPMTPPIVLEVSMTEANELKIIFDQPLAYSALNPSCYSVSHEMGTPLSANSIMNQYGIQLRFRNLFPLTEDSFVLTLHSVYSAVGIQPLQTEYTFSYNPDYTPPFIQTAEVLTGARSVRITLSETLYHATALNPENYELITPANDTSNGIESISVDENVVTVTLTDKLKYSNRFYYIVIRNVTDLAGNLIAPNQNSCRFYLYDIENLDKIVVYPNPVKAKEYDAVNFMNFPRDKKGRLAIYTLAGELVFNTSIGPFNPDNNNVTYRWDLQNQSGKGVASGIYYYVINMGGETRRGKFAVLN